MFRRALLPIPFAAALLTLAACGSSSNSPTTSTSSTPTTAVSAQDAVATATPIKHVVVIFGENRSFDHYFATYPNAVNPAGEPAFTAAANTPANPNGLTSTLLTANPNSTAAGNGANAKNPFRLDRTQANTYGQNHAYTAEQEAYDNGAADLFPEFTGTNTATSGLTFGTPGLVMGYYDGNTVTALWNYANNFAMSSNMYTDTYGPSTPGAIHVISGQANGVIPNGGVAVAGSMIDDGNGGFSVVGDPDPTGDTCSGATTGKMGTSNKNIGDLLNAKSITWGGFTGGFDLTRVNANGTTGCARTTYSSVLNTSPKDYSPHHNWFAYYPTTANGAHTRPTSTAVIGYTDPLDSSATPVHHQYDVEDFFTAVSAGNYPSVSYLKAPMVGDGHPGNSDPLDEQAFVVKVLNFLQQQPDWKSTAVIITYDDSDGWYDHRYIAPQTASFSTSDALNGASTCGISGTTPQGVGPTGLAVNGRCGPGTRVPLIVVSPYAKQNYIDDTQISQSSVVKFIEDNWLGGQRIGGGSNDAAAGSIMSLFDFTNGGKTPVLYLDPNTGTKLSSAPTS